VTDWARELAENPNTYVPLRPGHERIVADRYVLWLGRGDHPGWTVAQRFRFAADDIDDVRAEIHGHVRAKGRTACSWEVGSSATPPDLVELLLERGLVMDDEPVRVGMALTTEPPAVDGVEVRQAVTEDDRRAAAELGSVVFGTGFGELPPPDPHNAVYLASIAGTPVGRASAAFGEHGMTMSGAGVLAEARGRGVYRALVRARWDDAVARGLRLAVTDAGSMSRPILARLGFREVCTIHCLVDRLP